MFYTAIRQKDLPLMLKGTAVLMVMALILDLALSAAERRLNDRRWRKPAPSWLRWTGGLVCAALAAWAATAMEVGLLRKFFGAFLIVVGLMELFGRTKE